MVQWNSRTNFGRRESIMVPFFQALLLWTARVTAEPFCPTIKIITTRRHFRDQLVKTHYFMPGKRQRCPKSHLVAEARLEPRSPDGCSNAIFYQIKSKVSNLFTIYWDNINKYIVLLSYNCSAISLKSKWEGLNLVPAINLTPFNDFDNQLG